MLNKEIYWMHILQYNVTVFVLYSIFFVFFGCSMPNNIY